MNIKRLLILTGTVFFGLTLAMMWLMFLSGPPELAHAASHTVCPTGPPDCDYSTIQAAVDAANDGDIIKVAQGQYTSVVSQVVYIDKAITLAGGYSITNWEISDPLNQPTVIDAEDAYRRGVYIDGSGVPTITLRALTVQKGKPEEHDGAGIFVQNATMLLQDSIVRDNSNTEGGGGGGLYARDCTIVLTGNTFQSNHAAGGGGLRIESSNVTISGNSVLSNTAFFDGGLMLTDSTVATVRDNTFRGNSGGEAGGIGVHDNAFVTLSGNIILSNSSAIDLSRPGGGLLVDGGTVVATGNHIEDNSAFDGAGIYVDNPDGSVTLSANTIVSNPASTDGGKGGGLYVNRGTVLVQGNTIQSNNAAGGGGIAIVGGTVTLRSNQILSNAAFFGGGVRISNGTVTMSSNVFLGNMGGTDQGPSIHIRRGTVDAENDIIADSGNNHAGEAVFVEGGTLTARHWTLSNNGGYAIKTDGGSTVLTNTLVASHTLGGLSGAGIVADTTLFYNSGTPCSDSATCTNSLSGDPKFVNPAESDYHVSADSAAIDAGVDAGVADDIDGQRRPVGAGYDIGADEFGYWIYLPLVLRNN